MSSTLKWRPNKTKGSLPDELKWKLKLHSSRVFDKSDIPFLEGLAACEIKGAKQLIQLIEKHEEIVLSEEN